MFPLSLKHTKLYRFHSAIIIIISSSYFCQHLETYENPEKMHFAADLECECIQLTIYESPCCC